MTDKSAHTSDEITPELIADIQGKAKKITATLGVTSRAVTKNGIYKTSENVFLSRNNTTVFSDEITTGDVTDQEYSGRCWLFTVLNVIRHSMEKSLKLENIELSEAYSFFWDKFERANVFYGFVIEMADRPLTDRRLQTLLDEPQDDGGRWTYAAPLLAKYGVVPKTAMPDPETMKDTREINKLLNRKLRRDAVALRALAKTASTDELEAKRREFLADVYALLCTAFGTPPETFRFSYRDKDKKYRDHGDMTPREFMRKFADTDFSEYVTLRHEPIEGRAINQTYVQDLDVSMAGVPQTVSLNVSFEDLRAAALAQVKDGQSVYLSCDIRSDITRSGFLSLDAYDFNGTFGIDFTMSKGDRLATQDEDSNHALTIVGVDIKDGKPVQWKLENSWGDDVGKKGYYTMSDAWFAEHGYGVDVKKKYLGEALLEALKKEPIRLEAWE